MIWLTEEAEAFLARERQVLDPERLAAVIARISTDDKRGLLAGLRALVRAAEAGADARTRKTKEERR